MEHQHGFGLCVVVENEIYVRAYNGKSSSWYQAALNQKEGKISIANLKKEVYFEPVNDPEFKLLNDKIDDAYRLKYKGNPYLKLQMRSCSFSNN